MTKMTKNGPTQSETMSLVKIWNEIQRHKKELDFRLSKWAAELRSKWDDGSHGDRLFVQWTAVELGYTVTQANEQLLRAVAANIVADAQAWNVVGGFRAIRRLEHLGRKDQVVVLEEAKLTGCSLGSILKKRGLEFRYPRLSVVDGETPEPKPIEIRQPTNRKAMSDAEQLAVFLVGLPYLALPPDIAVIVGMYAPAKIAVK